MPDAPSEGCNAPVAGAGLPVVVPRRGPEFSSYTSDLEKLLMRRAKRSIPRRDEEASAEVAGTPACARNSESFHRRRSYVCAWPQFRQGTTSAPMVCVGDLEAGKAALASGHKQIHVDDTITGYTSLSEFWEHLDTCPGRSIATNAVSPDQIESMKLVFGGMGPRLGVVVQLPSMDTSGWRQAVNSALDVLDCVERASGLFAVGVSLDVRLSVGRFDGLRALLQPNCGHAGAEGREFGFYEHLSGRGAGTRKECQELGPRA